ncbi:hypothetical protein NDU88_007746 [Pleurodeles waltl]|uniref:Uncharacterized protein n=1 Tax=Pleurodeles waltl TaxID=8319 RepID=A0AAV7RQB8_PLEWA|nr:hypothetical protein NDU88_007746 [Pleurodeles waltl]
MDNIENTSNLTEIRDTQVNTNVDDIDTSETGEIINQCLCSRATDAAASFPTDPGSAWHPTATNECKTAENGNLDIRIPINLPVEEQKPQHQEKREVAVNARNPDIQVPKSVKREEGLCVARIEEEKDAEEEDAEEKRTEITDREDNEEDESNSDLHLGSTEPGHTRETPTEGQDSPERPKLRHVHGVTWLKQKRLWECLGQGDCFRADETRVTDGSMVGMKPGTGDVGLQ